MTEWVAFPAVASNEAHVSVTIDGPTPGATYPDNLPSGHFRILAKVEDLGNGDFLYSYAVMNFDFDQGFQEFEVPLPPGAVVSSTYMGGPQDVMTTPWTTNIESDAVRFRAPAGQKLPWFTLYNFEVTVNQAPAAQSEVVLIPFTSREQPLPTHVAGDFLVTVPSPAERQNNSVFSDRFEQN